MGHLTGSRCSRNVLIQMVWGVNRLALELERHRAGGGGLTPSAALFPPPRPPAFRVENNAVSMAGEIQVHLAGSARRRAARTLQNHARPGVCPSRAAVTTSPGYTIEMRRWHRQFGGAISLVVAGMIGAIPKYQRQSGCHDGCFYRLRPCWGVLMLEEAIH